MKKKTILDIDIKFSTLKWESLNKLQLNLIYLMSSPKYHIFSPKVPHEYLEYLNTARLGFPNNKALLFFKGKKR